MTRWLVAWGPAALWAAGLYLLSSRPTLPVNLVYGLDKVAHFLAYLVLGYLFTHATQRLQISVLLAIGLGLGYGVLDELHQSSVPGRDASIFDWLADAGGTVSGVMLYLSLMRARNRSGYAPDFDSAEPT